MITAALLAIVSTAFVPQQAGSAPLTDPVLEARVQKLGKQLRCTVCQGMSIADSPAGMARSQLDKTREMVAAGKTDEEIKEYFTARYGEWVLLEPPSEGFAVLVWLMPMLMVLGGFVFVMFFIRSRNAAPPPAAIPSPPAPAADDEYLRAVRAELER